MDKKALEDLLNSAPLPASANHSRLVDRINKQQQAIGFLLTALAQQGSAILDIRNKMVEHKAAIEGVGEAIFGDDGPEPKVILPHQGLVGFEDVQRS